MQNSDSDSYVYGLDLISRTASAGSQEYYLTDGLGSTTGLAPGTGSVAVTYQYDVFGSLRSQTGTSPNEFTFTGEQVDTTGMQYLRARYHDNATGRFLSQDPLPLLQRYLYVGNNPVNMVDPSGLIGLPDIDLPDIPTPGEIIDYVEDKAQDTVGLAGQCWINPRSCGSDTAAFLLSLFCTGDRHNGPGGWAYYENARGGCEFMWRIFGEERVACYTPGYLTFCREDTTRALRCHEYQHYIQSRLIPFPLYWAVATTPFAGERDARAAGHDKESRVPFTGIHWPIQCS